MINTQRDSRFKQVAACLAFGFMTVVGHSPSAAQTTTITDLQSTSQMLSARQQAIVPIAAFGAAGDMTGLATALNQGLDAGLTVSDAKEILIQLYAYAGFPRSLNALNELMKVVEARKQSGRQDVQGQEPMGPMATGDELLTAGTANQTKILGRPAKGAVYEFAPAMDQYLKSHLFGAIFERDNLDWQSRELATVSMLSALSGVGSELQAHMGFSLNQGVTLKQLAQLTQVLADRVSPEFAARARSAFVRQVADQ